MPSAWDILSQRAAICTALGLFCTNYFWYFLITWLPLYLQNERHFSAGKMTTVASAAYFAIALSSTVAGYFSDHWIARGATPNRVRKTFVGVGLTLSTIILPVALVKEAGTAIALLLLACFCFGLILGTHLRSRKRWRVRARRVSGPACRTASLTSLESPRRG